MFETSEADEGVNAYLQEWSHWVRERDQWIEDVDQWGRHLRQLILLIHELDNALPYERQRLAEHLDAVKEHLKTLESHGRLLNRIKIRAGHGMVAGMPSDVRKEHDKLRYEHARVRDAHLGLRHQHQQAMERVDELLGRFKNS